MIRPKQLLSFSPQATKTRTTTSTTMWVIVQFCLIFLQILATAIPPVHCDKDFPSTNSTAAAAIVAAASSISASQGSNAIANSPSNNDKLLHRVARLTKVDYTLLSNDEANNNSRSHNAGGWHPYNSAAYLASNGLRTPLKPQKFYTKEERFPSGNGAKGKNANMVTLNLVTEPRKDICNGHCQCEKKNAFTTVVCDFRKNSKLNPIFDKTFKMPELAKSLVVKLGPKTFFRLQEGFFHNDTINRFIIEGNMSEYEKVEIGTDAFQGNNGPFPEIAFTNVFAIIILQRAFKQANSESCKLNVTNSNDVLLFENSFENTQIKGTFVGIKDLRISEKAFTSAQARLHIESSNIDNIYRFDASIREIKFVKCTIGTINPGAFDVNNIHSIIFESCRIDAIKSRAITEKLYSEHVSITGASIGLIESDAIYGSGIKELKITNNKIDTISENAIYVTSIYVNISGNNVKHLGTKWLHVKDWNRVTVTGNQFGVFGHMLLESSKSSESCAFESNSLTSPQDGSLNFTKPYCRVREISVNKACRCDTRWLERLSDHDLRSEIYCTIDDKLGNCFNATILNFLKYYNEVCDDTKTILDCKNNKNLKKIQGRFFTAEELAAKNKDLPELIIIGAGVLISIIILVLFVCCLWRRLTKQSHADNSHGRSHVHEFSQEERVIINQSSQLIQKKHPEYYKKFNELIQIMYIQDLPEKKCVKTISQIVNLLNKVKNPGTDFMALNRVLTEHLQSPLPTAPPADHTPIYSEPSMTGMDEDFNTSTTFSGLPSDGFLGTVGAVGGPEHIYAEPSCAQQPLLPNEYASPADGHLETVDVYTEPINERESNLTTPYAVTRPRPTYQSPYRPMQYATPPRTQYTHQQRQLPDVLSQHNTLNPHPATRTTAPTNTITIARRMAQELQDKTNFNPIAKPRNMHLLAPPTYTAPDIRHKQLLKNPFTAAVGAGIAARGPSEDIELDMRGATALPTATDSGSNHSGGSNETVQIDDAIQYADS
uniref:Right handed beta helix domain-containing protein n=1 Tax=Stomoxys calcitrans TaxID=35570 RepID=A0A1I8P772_STOCA